jgi:outer membrane murein-binding lipoprotein Lpp
MRISLTVVPVLLAAALLAGCGDTQSADQKAMNAKFEQIDYQISRLETVTSQYNTGHFEAATKKYIALVHQYQDALGPEEAKQRLTDRAEELSGYCLPCAGELADAAKQY